MAAKRKLVTKYPRREPGVCLRTAEQQSKYHVAALIAVGVRFDDVVVGEQE